MTPPRHWPTFETCLWRCRGGLCARISRNGRRWSPLGNPRQPRQRHRTGHADADEPGDVQVTGVGEVGGALGPNLAVRNRCSNNPQPRSSPAADLAVRSPVQRGIEHPGYFRPYTNADVIGTGIGGACKNVIALACGMAAGVGLGETPPRPSSPAAWPRMVPPGHHRERAPRWLVWPESATWWRHAVHHRRAKPGASARCSVRAHSLEAAQRKSGAATSRRA